MQDQNDFYGIHRILTQVASSFGSVAVAVSKSPQRLITAELYPGKGRELLLRIVAMLTKMARADNALCIGST